jgi:Ca2+-binding EF-hand superfamily protein
LKSIGVDTDKEFLYKLLNDLDDDQSGDINFEEFLKILTDKITVNDSKDDIRRVFEKFSGNDDHIELRHL